MNITLDTPDGRIHGDPAHYHANAAIQANTETPAFPREHLA